MKILYEGNSITIHAHCTEAHVTATLRAMGHRVEFAAVQQRTTPELHGLLDGFQPDVFLLTRPWGTAPLADAAFLEKCARLGVPTCGFHLDRFWQLPEREAWIRERSDPLFCLDVLFSTDDGPEWADAGIAHHWLPPAVFAPEAYDAEPNPDWQGRWDVGFVGSYGYHPEWPHRWQMVDHLREWYGDRFVHVGNGGDLGPLRGHDLNRFYASVPVVVGDSCFAERGRAYWSDRVPETWGRGGFLIHPEVRAMGESLHEAALPGYGWEPGKWDSLQFITDSWLAEAGERHALRYDLAQEVRERHTYTQRMEELLGVVAAL